ncbi:MAG: cell division protein [Alphaproteobacteria bacterium]|nr:cell division protein [Alphaproteobacteria bacterium]
MSVSGLFNRRVRGFRVVEVVGMGLLLTLVTGVYLAKTVASGERNEIAQIEQRIEDEKTRKRLLEAEVAFLEQPRRIEALAVAMGLRPIAADHETTEDALVDVARHHAVAAPIELPAGPVDAAALAADAPEATPDDAPAPEVHP